MTFVLAVDRAALSGMVDRDQDGRYGDLADRIRPDNGTARLTAGKKCYVVMYIEGTIYGLRDERRDYMARIGIPEAQAGAGAKDFADLLEGIFRHPGVDADSIAKIAGEMRDRRKERDDAPPAAPSSSTKDEADDARTRLTELTILCAMEMCLWGNLGRQNKSRDCGPYLRDADEYLRDLARRGVRPTLLILEAVSRYAPDGLSDDTNFLAQAVLPARLTTLFGRDDQVKCITRLLLRKRTVLLHNDEGLSGVGATSLCAEIGHQLSRFFLSGAVAFVDVERMYLNERFDKCKPGGPSEEDIVNALALSLHVEIGEKGDTRRDPVAHLAAALRPCPRFIVLDGCDLSDGPEKGVSAGFTERLLHIVRRLGEECSDLFMLLTARGRTGTVVSAANSQEIETHLVPRLNLGDAVTMFEWVTATMNPEVSFSLRRDKQKQERIIQSADGIPRLVNALATIACFASLREAIGSTETIDLAVEVAIPDKDHRKEANDLLQDHRKEANDLLLMRHGFLFEPLYWNAPEKFKKAGEDSLSKDLSREVILNSLAARRIILPFPSSGVATGKWVLHPAVSDLLMRGTKSSSDSETQYHASQSIRVRRLIDILSEESMPSQGSNDPVADDAAWVRKKYDTVFSLMGELYATCRYLLRELRVNDTDEWQRHLLDLLDLLRSMWGVHRDKGMDETFLFMAHQLWLRLRERFGGNGDADDVPANLRKNAKLLDGVVQVMNAALVSAISSKLPAETCDMWHSILRAVTPELSPGNHHPTPHEASKYPYVLNTLGYYYRTIMERKALSRKELAVYLHVAEEYYTGALRATLPDIVTRLDLSKGAEKRMTHAVKLEKTEEILDQIIRHHQPYHGKPITPHEARRMFSDAKWPLHGLAQIAQIRGEWSYAEVSLRYAKAISQRLGDSRGTAQVCLDMARLLRQPTNRIYGEASALLKDAVRLAWELKDTQIIVEATEEIAGLAALQGKQEYACRIAYIGQRIAQLMGGAGIDKYASVWFKQYFQKWENSATDNSIRAQRLDDWAKEFEDMQEDELVSVILRTSSTGNLQEDRTRSKREPDGGNTSTTG